jgi:hypothetical protein
MTRGLALVLAVSFAPLATQAQEVATSDPALICGKVAGMSYTRQHRALLLEDERQADFARYGIPWSQHKGYELDHIVPLCLGGADTPANRRPQRCDKWIGIDCVAGPAYEKDLVEEQACQAICRATVGRQQLIKIWQDEFAKWKP